MGHRAVAIDFPGYGKSIPEAPVSDHLEFMEKLIKVLKLGPAPVIVSPSMSGKFSLPYLVSHPDMVKGYVPVAPVNTEFYTEEFPSIKVRMKSPQSLSPAGGPPITKKTANFLQFTVSLDANCRKFVGT